MSAGNKMVVRGALIRLNVQELASCQAVSESNLKLLCPGVITEKGVIVGILHSTRALDNGFHLQLIFRRMVACFSATPSTDEFLRYVG